MARVALINYHLGSIPVSEALFRTLDYEVVSIVRYHQILGQPSQKMRYKILRGIRAIYRRKYKTQRRESKTLD